MDGRLGEPVERNDFGERKYDRLRRIWNSLVNEDAAYSVTWECAPQRQLGFHEVSNALWIGRVTPAEMPGSLSMLVVAISRTEQPRPRNCLPEDIILCDPADFEHLATGRINQAAA